MILGRLALFDKKGVVLVAVWAKAEELAVALRRMRIQASGHPASRFEDCEDLYVDP